MISRIDHLNIVVRDLEQAISFFSLLGFNTGISSQLDPEFLQRLTGVRCAGGRFTALHHPQSNVSLELLQFHTSEEPDAGIGIANHIGLRHLAFAVTDIEAEVERLRRHGVDFIGDVQVWQKTGKKLIYFHGPEGILLELAQYPEQ